MKKFFALCMILTLFLTSVGVNAETEVLVSKIAYEGAKLELSPEVNENYFDDAVFIGDSLTLSIEERRILKNAKFIANVGASISNCANSRIFKYKNTGYTLKELLQIHLPKKIYIMIGTNTLTFSKSADAIEPYKELLNVIITDFPETPIYIIGLPTMRNGAIKKLRKKHPDFSNNRILDFNKRLETLAEEAHCYYLDLGEEFRTSKKDVQPKKEFMAPDGIHFSIEGAEKFKDFIRTHTAKGE